MKGPECSHLYTRRCGSDGTRIYGSADLHHVRCDRCDVLLPFGPANDTPEALVELRAAELAANGGPMKTCGASPFDDCEECGWDTWPWIAPENAAEEAGWLARAIATHNSAAGASRDGGK